MGISTALVGVGLAAATAQSVWDVSKTLRQAAVTQMRQTEFGGIAPAPRTDVVNPPQGVRAAAVRLFDGQQEGVEFVVHASVYLEGEGKVEIDGMSWWDSPAGLDSTPHQLVGLAWQVVRDLEAPLTAVHGKRRVLTNHVLRKYGVKVWCEPLHFRRVGESVTAAMAVALFTAAWGLQVRDTVAVTGDMDAAGRLVPVAGMELKVQGLSAVVTEFHCASASVPAAPDNVVQGRHGPITLVGHDTIEQLLQAILVPPAQPLPANQLQATQAVISAHAGLRYGRATSIDSVIRVSEDGTVSVPLDRKVGILAVSRPAAKQGDVKVFHLRTAAVNAYASAAVHWMVMVGETAIAAANAPNVAVVNSLRKEGGAPQHWVMGRDVTFDVVGAVSDNDLSWTGPGFALALCALVTGRQVPNTMFVYAGLGTGGELQPLAPLTAGALRRFREAGFVRVIVPTATLAAQPGAQAQQATGVTVDGFQTILDVFLDVNF